MIVTYLILAFNSTRINIQFQTDSCCSIEVPFDNIFETSFRAIFRRERQVFNCSQEEFVLDMHAVTNTTIRILFKNRGEMEQENFHMLQQEK